MKIEELLNLYHVFFEKLNEEKLSEEEKCRPQKMEAASQEEVDQLATDFNLFIPDDLREFWCTPKTVYEISRFSDNEEWEAGFDFCDINIVRREIPSYRELADNYDDEEEDEDPIKILHLNAVPISYSEPALIYNANAADTDPYPGIYLMLWDGEPADYPIADDFTTFFTHWLASGCFRGREFKKYWEVVKDFVPIKIPIEENLWLRYYENLYAGQYEIF